MQEPHLAWMARMHSLIRSRGTAPCVSCTWPVRCARTHARTHASSLRENGNAACVAGNVIGNEGGLCIAGALRRNVTLSSLFLASAYAFPGNFSAVVCARGVQHDLIHAGLRSAGCEIGEVGGAAILDVLQDNATLLCIDLPGLLRGGERLRLLAGFGRPSKVARRTDDSFVGSRISHLLAKALAARARPV